MSSMKSFDLSQITTIKQKFLLLACILLAASTLTAHASKKIQYHIIPHTHDDAGWLTSVEGYYTGQSSPFRECVKCILDNLVNILDKDPNRVFPYAEIVFVERWWRDQNATIKEKVKKFVHEGRLQFPNGGWVTNDEACTYYDDIIEHMVIGHNFLKKEFNYIPRVGWHIDPFGHSSAQAALMSQMGINMFFFERIDQENYDSMQATKDYEFIWRPSGATPENYLIGHMNYFKYGGTANLGYCFPDNICQWGGGGTDLNKLNLYINDQKFVYPTSNIMFQIGSDFSFSIDGHGLYNAIERFVADVNASFGNTTIAILSTPENYMNAWYKDYSQDKSIKLRTKTDDFFPYMDMPGWIPIAGYWTGYFTSKGNIKIMVKESSQKLNNFRKIFTKVLLATVDEKARSNLFLEYHKSLDELERALSVTQHHDGVSGTSKAWVTGDYMNQMRGGIDRCSKHADNISAAEIQENYNETVHFGTCQSNGTSADCKDYFITVVSNGSALLRVFNPGKSGNILIKAKVNDYRIEVINQTNDKIVSDVICSENERGNLKDCDLFIRDHFNALEFKNYKIRFAENASKIAQSVYDPHNLTLSILPIDSRTNFTIFDFKNFELSYCKQNGGFDHSAECLSEEFAIDYEYYRSNSISQASGAYIMRTLGFSTYTAGIPNKLTISRGELVTEIKILRNKTQIDNANKNLDIISKIRFYKDAIEKGIEIESFVFSLDWPGENMNGKELILKVKSRSIKNRNTFFTDENGLQMMERILNYKPEYDVDRRGDVVPGNYFPVNSAIYVEDPKTGLRVTLMNDRSQGGSSFHRGEVELMIHRKTNNDDSRGVGESLQEPGDLSCKHTLLITNEKKGLPSHQRNIQYWNDNAPLILYAPSNTITFNPPVITSAIPSELPEDIKVHIRSYEEGEYMIRFHNMNEKSSIQFDFFDAQTKTNHILTQFLNINSSVSADVEELGLSANQPKSEVLKRKFVLREVQDVNLTALLDDTDYSKLKFRPLELRVFLLKNVKIVEGRNTTSFHGSNLLRNLDEDYKSVQPIRPSSRHGTETNIQVYLNETNITKILEQAKNDISDVKIIISELIFLVSITAFLALVLVFKIRRGRRTQRAMENENTSQGQIKSDRKATDDL